MKLFKTWFLFFSIIDLLRFGLCVDDDDDAPDVEIIGSNDWDFTESKRIHILFSG
jgi:hypothetical protein